MNTQMVKPRSPSYEQDQVIGGGLHSAGGHHEQDEHHEKKSVSKKVKGKAKKIKSTIGSKIQGGHDHEQEQHDPDQDMDEEDESDDELEQDPEVHGAPMYESSDVKMGNENIESGPTHVDKGHTGPAGIKFGEEGVPGPKKTDFSMKSSSGPTNDKAHTGQTRTNLGMSKTGESKTGSGIHAPLETDPNAPKDHFGNATSGNYQSKVDDPTGAGAKEADMEPITQSFGRMEVNDEPGQKHASAGTGSHGQFSPDSTATKSVPHQGFETKTDNMNVDEKPNRNPSYTEKITSGTSAIAGYAGSALTGTAASARNVVGYATSTITGTALAAKNAVASKLGYGGNDNSNIATQDKHLTRNEGAQTGDQTKSSAAAVGGYGRQISSTVSEKLAPVYGTVAGVGSAVVTPVYEKVAGAGSAVKSKIQGTGSNTGTGTGTGTGGVGSVTEQDEGGVSVEDYLVQKISPGDEDKALSEVISGVMHKKKDEFPETVAQNMDRVTDSPEVARSLGTGEREYRKDGDHQGFGNDGSSIGGGVGSPGGTGMVGRVKGVVGSWFGKGTGDQITANEQRSGGVVGGREDEGHETSST